MLFGDLWAYYSLRLGKVESENPRCSAAAKWGHFDGMRVIRACDITAFLYFAQSHEGNFGTRLIIRIYSEVFTTKS